MAVMTETDKSGGTAEQDAVADARRLLLVHRAAPDGLCTGRLEFTWIFAWHPCTQARWALKVTTGGAAGARS
jgi:hypothetical protein